MNLRDYLQVKDAAEFLGVSPSTLRNWERAGKITAYRNPVNGYRLFRRSDLEQLLADIERSASPTSDGDSAHQRQAPR
jgi:MerR family transcriptional regulator, copper efflux regulator